MANVKKTKKAKRKTFGYAEGSSARYVQDMFIKYKGDRKLMKSAMVKAVKAKKIKSNAPEYRVDRITREINAKKKAGYTLV